MKLLDDSNNQNFHTPTNGNALGTTLGIKITLNNQKIGHQKSKTKQIILLYKRSFDRGHTLTQFYKLKKEGTHLVNILIYIPPQQSKQSQLDGWDGMGWMHERMDGWDPI